MVYLDRRDRSEKKDFQASQDLLACKETLVLLDCQV